MYALCPVHFTITFEWPKWKFSEYLPQHSFKNLFKWDFITKVKLVIENRISSEKNKMHMMRKDNKIHHEKSINDRNMCMEKQFLQLCGTLWRKCHESDEKKIHQLQASLKISFWSFALISSEQESTLNLLIDGKIRGKKLNVCKNRRLKTRSCQRVYSFYLFLFLSARSICHNFCALAAQESKKTQTILFRFLRILLLNESIWSIYHWRIPFSIFPNLLQCYLNKICYDGLHAYE